MSELVKVHVSQISIIFHKEDTSCLNRYSLHTDAHAPKQFLGMHREHFCWFFYVSVEPFGQ